jgi:alpha-2-macroglobulin
MARRHPVILTLSVVTFLFCAGLLCAGPLESDEAAAGAKKAPELKFFGSKAFLPAKKALLEGRFEEALTLLEAEAGGDFREEALYRRGGLLIQLGRFKEALLPLEKLAGEFPKGRLFHKARFLRAQALSGLKRFAEASAIYEEEIAHLISRDRKEEIAQYYLKYADALADRERRDGPQHEKAIDLYRRALHLEIPGLVDEEVRFKIAAALHELKKYGEEEQVLIAFRKRHPESPSLDEADYRIAEARLKGDRPAEARKAFRDFLRDHPESIRVPDARYGIALSYKVPEPRSDTELSLGVKALEEFLARAPDNRLAPKAHYQIGLSYMHRGRLDEAIGAFKKFITVYSARPDVEQIAGARYRLASCHQGQKNYAAALVQFKEFLGRHPSHELWDDAQMQIVAIDYEWGLDLLREKKYDDARNRLLDFISHYPLDSRTQQAYFVLGHLELKREAYDAAIGEWERLVSKYPKSDLASQAQYRIGLIFESKLVDLEKALAAYEKVTYGPYHGEARVRILAMKAKTLTVVTERAFRSNEKPKVKITTRNIREVSMRFYRIDMEDYFVKRGTIYSVEDLDIDLIEPEKKWIAPVEDFKKYAELSREVDLPFTDPGAYVLNVSDDERTATALVLVTDLQMILKSGHEDVLVFVEDVRRKVPFEGAKVIVSDKNKVLFRGTTGKDGVFHKSDKALKQVSSLNVLVAEGGHFASNNLNLSGLASSKGLKSKAFLFTDKPIYKPGQMVRLKGFVREVSQGRYTIPRGGVYTMILFGPEGRTVAERTVGVDEFGGIDVDFALARSAPYGNYRATLKARSGWTENRTFKVGEYIPPRVTVEADMETDVFYQGETVKGAFKVFYNYGEPARGKTVRYSYGTGVSLEGAVDDEGRVSFSIDTRDFGGAGKYSLVAEVLEEDAWIQKTIHISDTAFSLKVEFSRDVVLSGEQVTVAVRASKPDGKPAGAEAELRVIFLEEKDGVRSEHEVDRIEGIAVDKKTGRGSAVVRLDKGGSYRIRTVAKDRFNNMITARRDLFVSGEEDKVKLRVFADDAACDAGGTTKICVHSRAETGLALVTCEGERVFHYEVRDLDKGDNGFPVKITSDLAPNFTFAVALMDGHRFHKAQVDLNVRSSLNVTVVPDRAEVSPGGKVKVTLTAVDRAGRPVEAEFALAAVDSALLSQFPDGTGPIHEFFYGLKRKGRLNTDSSCTFEYKARTETIDAALQEETVRRELLAKAADEKAVWAEGADLAMLDAPVESEVYEMEDAESVNDVIGIGGGAGGRFGGKYRRRASKKGGGVSARGAATGGSGFFTGHGRKNELSDKLKSLGYTGGDLNIARSISVIDDPGMADVPFEVVDGAQYAWGNNALFFNVSRSGQGGDEAAAVRKRFLETAYWNPTIRTGSDGTATVEIELPDNTTTWKLIARGITKETVGGKAEGEVVARKNFFVELNAPQGLVEGDETGFMAILVNTSEKKLDIAMELTLDGPVAGTATLKRETHLAAGGVDAIRFPVKAASPGLIRARLSARATGPDGRIHRDVVASSIGVKPMGVEITAGRGGAASGSWSGKVALPGGRTYAHTYMEIEVGPSLSDSLLHMADASYRYCCLPTFSDMASQVLVKLNVLDYVRRSGHARTAGFNRLEKGVENLLSSLLLAQTDQGSFPWIRKGAESPRATAQALKAMACAREMGFSVPEDALRKAAAWIDKQTRQVSGDERAYFLHAYSFYEKPDFTFLNSLFRKRADLSDRGRALLALAFHRSGHRDNAGTLVSMLIDRARPEGAPWASGLKRSSSLKGKEPVTDDRIRPTASDEYMTAACATLAVALSKPKHAVVKRGVDYLLSAGGSHRRPGPAHAATSAALAEYLASAGLAASDYTLSILVNGHEVKKLVVEGPHPVTSVPVPVDALLPGGNDVSFRFNGRGNYSFAVRMSGFTKDVKPQDYKETQAWIQRRYFMAPLLHEGRAVGSGFGTVLLPRGFSKWEHELKEINQGETARVELRYSLSAGSGDRLHPLVVTDTLPAGCRVVETGITGAFDHYEIGPGTITFYVRGRSSKVSYPIYAAFPGSYRSPPAVVRSTYNPAINNNTDAFSLPLGKRGTEKKVAYRMTPDELYNLGVALVKDKDSEGALGYLEKFITGYAPREKYLVDAAGKLFRIAFDGGDDARLIRYFELLRERAPSLSLTFQETARVGTAYRARGEHEQALQILAMVAGSSFGREAKVAEALEKQGEVAGSLMFLADQIRIYPDLPEIQSAFFALSQAVLDKAGPEGGRPAIPGFSRRWIMASAIGLVVDFLATYPQNPIADEAAYSLVSSLLDLEQSADVVRLSPVFRKRWPKSRYRSSMEYAEAYALFETDRYAEATNLLKAVADVNPDKLNPAERDNRDLAVYILGQIDHAGGRIAEAVARYRQVIKKFADAAEAVEFFTAKSVSLPEISAFRSGEKVKVKLEYRNVPEVTLSVYKVDLMKLCLLKKSLNNVTNINLAGISPTLVETVKLGDGKDYKKKTHELRLPLGEKGAYMLVVQGEGAGCTGMALVADLALEVQEDAASGRVRVNVKDGASGSFLKNVYIKVIGSNQSAFQSGYTDLRGVFIADGVNGASTVIAERKGEYAFHRGSLALLSQPRQEKRKQTEAKQKESFKGRSRALQNVFGQNRAMQQRGAQQLQQIYQEDYQNVQIK